MGALDRILHRDRADGEGRAGAEADAGGQHFDRHERRAAGDAGERAEAQAGEGDAEQGDALVVREARDQLAAGRRAQDGAEQQAEQRHAGFRRRQAEIGLQVDRQVDGKADIGGLQQEDRQRPGENDAVAKDLQRNQGLLRPHEPKREQRPEDRRGGDDAENFGREPRIGAAAPVEREKQQRGRHDQQERSEAVDPVLFARACQFLERIVDDRHRHEPERQVDPEDQRPMQMLGEGAAEQRSGNAGDGPHARDPRRIARTLHRRHEIADNRLRQREQAAAADALDGPPGDEHRHVGGERADH